MDPAASQTPGSPHKKCPKTERPRDKTNRRNDDVQTCRQIYCQTKQDTEPMHPPARPGGRRVVFFLDKIEETTRACDNLLPTLKTHGSPQGVRKVKETMYRLASSILDQIEQWRENSSIDDTLNSLTSIETFLRKSRKRTSPS